MAKAKRFKALLFDWKRVRLFVYSAGTEPERVQH
jgi:hypothetical protein